MNNKPLKCPFCKSKLLQGEQKRYETLLDHVFDPNMRNHPLRETWVCNCAESEGVFWDDWGDLYSREYKSRKGLTSAINSGSRKCDEQFKREAILRKSTIGRLILEIQHTLTLWMYRIADWKIKKDNYTLKG